MKHYINLSIIAMVILQSFCSLNGQASGPEIEPQTSPHKGKVEVKLDISVENCRVQHREVLAAKILVRYKDGAKTNPEGEVSNGLTYLGNHSIFLEYDPETLLFSTYKSENFDENNTCYNQQFGEYSPYWNQTFDGSVPGKFLLTSVLRLPTTELVLTCTPINEWTVVGTVYFRVLDRNNSTGLFISGTTDGFPTDSRGTNFSDDTNQNKYNQLLNSIEGHSVERLCEESNNTVRKTDDSFMNQIELKDDIKISPNPFNEVINIEYKAAESGLINIQLYNELGQKLKDLLVDQSIEKGANNFVVNLYELPRGIYFIQTKMNGNVQIKKVVKMN